MWLHSSVVCAAMKTILGEIFYAVKPHLKAKFACNLLPNISVRLFKFLVQVRIYMEK